MGLECREAEGDKEVDSRSEHAWLVGHGQEFQNHPNCSGFKYLNSSFGCLENDLKNREKKETC